MSGELEGYSPCTAVHHRLTAERTALFALESPLKFEDAQPVFGPPQLVPAFFAMQPPPPPPPAMPGPYAVFPLSVSHIDREQMYVSCCADGFGAVICRAECMDS